MEKISVGIIFGGVSSEHEVSLLSAASVLSKMDTEKYLVHKIGITKEGRMFYYTGTLESIKDGSWCRSNCIPCILSPDRAHHGVVLLTGTPGVVHLDVAFPVLHGKNGEDGTIQGLLTMAGIPFVGCGTLASACCMDKVVTHILLDAAGIKQAKWLWTSQHEYRKAQEPAMDQIEKTLGYPCFVKPANAGSSVGITKAADRTTLQTAMETAFRHDSKVIVEQMVHGIELECAVMGNEEPVASCVGEIDPSADFYDYNAKYIDGSTKTYAPARICDQSAEAVRATAIRAYQVMGCTGLARVDFFLTHHNQEIVLNEINTIPGFTSISMYPQLFGVSGVAYDDLIDQLIGYALPREVDKEQN